MKSIVKEIINAIENYHHFNPDAPMWDELKHEMLEKEKEQIANAFDRGRYWNNSWNGMTYYEEVMNNPKNPDGD